ncbi:helix-turn-helix domain-containing protein [Paenibacillus sp. 2TAB19]|uniref:helix-turn-helix domain-containing protein n=1 Tax=Paenibacillus sp. 2TAB19 TaxID=3233003 RepID=UPI003F9AD25A
MHPNLLRFIESFEHEASLTGKFRSKLDKTALVFLEQVWGAAFDYNYDGLRAEFPFIDHKGGQRFADFVFVKNGIRLAIELDGFTTHASQITPGEFNDHLTRQNALVLSGWLLLRFSAWQAAHDSQRCIAQIKQAIGHWWSVAYNGQSGYDAKLWETRKTLLIQLARRRDAKLKPSEVAREFQISNRTAIDWLRRYEREGIFCGQTSGQRRITFYTLSIPNN